mmetsp:Transcript_118714/g.335809  ORF Transcript_118714/g.335809 Transcript_118714/m.335809 type:complete len:220 (+) Transcript_118714:77-736(+)
MLHVATMRKSRARGYPMARVLALLAVATIAGPMLRAWALTSRREGPLSARRLGTHVGASSGSFAMDRAHSSRRPVAKTRQRARKSRSGGDARASHVSIPELLGEYGLTAVTFHFFVWASCIVVVYTTLSLGVDISTLVRQLPEALRDKIGGEGSFSGDLGSAAATLAVVEVLGPARLALTISAAPAASKVARRLMWFRNTEAALIRASRAFASKFLVET